MVHYMLFCRRIAPKSYSDNSMYCFTAEPCIPPVNSVTESPYFIFGAFRLPLTGHAQNCSVVADFVFFAFIFAFYFASIFLVYIYHGCPFPLHKR